MKNLKKLIGVLLAVVLCLSLTTTGVLADTTDLSETLGAGTLSVTSPTSATFGGGSVSTTSQSADAAVIGDATHTNTTGIRVLDERGSGAGWSCIMTVTNLNIRKDAVTLAGANSTVTFSGTYDGVLGVQTTYKVFRVKITLLGAVGTAQYSWYKPGNDGTTPDGTAVVTSADATLLSNGVYVAFAAATYAVDDEWSVLVDVLPYTGLTITPSVIHAASGVTTGITAGSEVTVSGSTATSDNETVMTAAQNYGLGDYYIDVDLSQVIHINALVGEYTSLATITVS